MTDEFKETLDFAATRDLPELALGNSSTEAVKRYVDASVYRTKDGLVRGFKFGFSDSGGVVVTEQGDELWMDESGRDVSVRILADVATHETTPIETEETTLEDGTKIEFTKKPIGKLTGGFVQVGQPVLNAGDLISAKKAQEVIQSISFTTLTASDSLSGTNVVKSEFRLHDPFVDTSVVEENPALPPGMMREVDANNKRRDLTTTQTINAKDISNDDIRYITKITTI